MEKQKNNEKKKDLGDREIKTDDKPQQQDANSDSTVNKSNEMNRKMLLLSKVLPDVILDKNVTTGKSTKDNPKQKGLDDVPPTTIETEAGSGLKDVMKTTSKDGVSEPKIGLMRSMNMVDRQFGATKIESTESIQKHPAIEPHTRMVETDNRIKDTFTSGPFGLPTPTELTLLQAQMIKAREEETKAINTIVQASIYVNGTPMNGRLIIESSEVKLLPSLYTDLDIREGGPPVLFNMQNLSGALDVVTMRSELIYNYNDVIPEFIKQNTNTFAAGTGYVISKWEPDGWPCKIENLVDLNESFKIGLAKVVGTHLGFEEDLKMLYGRLKRMMGVINNKRLICILPGVKRVNFLLREMGSLIKKDMSLIIGSTLDDEEKLELQESRIKGCLPWAVAMPCSIDWGDFVFQEFINARTKMLFGRFGTISYAGWEVFGYSYGVLDNFSSYILNSCVNELRDNRVTMDQLVRVTNALKYDQTHFRLEFEWSDEQTRVYHPTADDNINLLICYFMDLGIQSKLIGYAREIVAGMGLFKKLDNMNFFTKITQASITPNKRSNLITLLAANYMQGNVESFLEMLVAEFYSAFFSIEYTFRKPERSYVGMFNILDILLHFIFFPKLAWSASATLGLELTKNYATIFPQQFKEFKAANGLISEYINGVWVRSELSFISQDDVIGRSGNPKQYSILVKAGGTESRTTNRIFNIIEYIQFIPGICPLITKVASGFPYASNTNMYYTSWPYVDNLTAEVDNTALGVRVAAVIGYINLVANISKKTDKIPTYPNDNFVLEKTLMELKEFGMYFAGILTKYGSLIAKTLANSYLIMYDWFTPTNYYYAQPLIGFGIQDNTVNEVRYKSMRPFSKMKAEFSMALNTHICLFVTGAESTGDGYENLILMNVNQAVEAYEIPLLPTNDLVKLYYELCYACKDEGEKMWCIRDWFTLGIFRDDVESFRTVLNKRNRYIISRLITETLQCRLFDKLLERIQVTVDNDVLTIDMDGPWHLILTDTAGSLLLNNTLTHNQIFGYDLFPVSQHFNNVYILSHFLQFSDNSPVYHRSRGVFISKTSVNTFIADAPIPQKNYTVVLDETSDLRFFTRIQTPDPVYNGSFVSVFRYNIAGTYYRTINDMLRANVYILLVIPSAKVLISQDLDKIYEMIIAGVLDIRITSVLMTFTIIPTISSSDFYKFETVPSESWIRNVALNCSDGQVLYYDLYDLRYPLRNNISSPIDYYRFVYAVGTIDDNLVAKYIVDDVNVVEYVPRVINTELWNSLEDPSIYNDGTSIIERRGLVFSNKLPYYTQKIGMTLAKVDTDGALSVV